MRIRTLTHAHIYTRVKYTQMYKLVVILCFVENLLQTDAKDTVTVAAMAYVNNEHDWTN